MKTWAIVMMLLVLGCSGPATAPETKAVTIEFGGGRTEADSVDECQDAIEFQNFVKKRHLSIWQEWYGGTVCDTVGGE